MFYWELLYFDCKLVSLLWSSRVSRVDGGNREVDQQTLTEKKVLSVLHCRLLMEETC
jgi:hypothetical protein